ncbi:MAG TPA: DUF3617 family protein [Allosphingosinicella sp.]|nr:DUF3617 family protein [Allosphingosinicella sp.]
MTRSALALALALLVPLAAAAAPRPFQSVDEFARAVGLKKGGWRTRVNLTSLDIRMPPGTDPEVAAKLKAEIAAEAAAGDEMECADSSSGAVTMPGILLDSSCTFSRIEAGEGRWALSSTCKAGPGGSSTIVGEGRYSTRRTTGRHQIDLSMAGVRLLMTAETLSRFVGECRPSVPVTFEVRAPDQSVEGLD